MGLPPTVTFMAPIFNPSTAAAFGKCRQVYAGEQYGEGKSVYSGSTKSVTCPCQVRGRLKSLFMMAAASDTILKLKLDHSHKVEFQSKALLLIQAS